VKQKRGGRGGEKGGADGLGPRGFLGEKLVPPTRKGKKKKRSGEKGGKINPNESEGGGRPFLSSQRLELFGEKGGGNYGIGGEGMGKNPGKKGDLMGGVGTRKGGGDMGLVFRLGGMEGKRRRERPKRGGGGGSLIKGKFFPFSPSTQKNPGEKKNRTRK